uniref:protein-serine/threonine phosphatase n=1 Tax=Anopheles gambiae TaxID=7165 RepID=A0A1S4GAY2_ANOGA
MVGLMALVTSPISSSGSSPINNSNNQDGTNNTDKKSARDEETQSKVIRGRSGCPKFSTSQGTIALMLGSGEHLRASCEDQLTATSITAAAVDPADDNADNGGSSSRSSSAANDDAPAASNGADGGGIGMADTGEGKVEGRAPSRPASSCSSGSSSSSSDIQQHLQSMTCLLRPEETLKMAVKLESLRTGRTRYLVVVSRTVTSKRHSTAGTTPYHGASGGTSSSIGSNAASSSTLQMVAAAAAPPATYATVASQQFGRVSSTVPSGQQQQHLRHSGSSSSSSETFNGSDTYVSSLDNCVLSVGCSAGGGRLPPTGGNAAPTCRSDQCDSKANSRLISSTVSVDAVTSPDYVGAPFASPSGGVDDATTLGGDRRSCAIDSTCLYEPGEQQLHPASSSTSAIPVEGGKKLEESCLLGIDCNERTTVGLVLKVLADTSIRLDGDGGFSVSSCGKQHIFKPVSVQAMWSALQTLHKASFKAREHNFFAGGPSHDWVAYYEAHIDSDRSCLNEWNAMDSLESRRPPSPGSIRNKPTEREETESVIRSKLKEVMMSVDLDDVTSKFIRGRLEELLDMDLGEYKPFIDAEMLVILGQMDAPTEIFDHVYLGSEWNASNLEELQRNGVHHILNVTREIDNFFPGLFHYCNVRVYDDEKTDLLRHWDNTFKFISRAKMEGSKVLVHCKMGISRSASVVIAYAMKANGWDFGQALQHVKEKRSCIKPNKNFLMQLETYQGMLDAMKNKEKLQRSKSETNLKLTGAKEGRSLPGSEPTPLIQALNGASGGGSGGGKKHTSFPIVHALGKEAVAVAEKAAPAPEEDPSADGVDEGDAGPCRGRTRTRQLKVGASGQQPDHRQGEPTSHPVPLGAAALASSSSPPGPASTAKAAAKCLANLYLPQGPYKPWSACDGRICTRAAGALKRHKSLSPESLNPRWPDGAEFAGSSLAYAEQPFADASKASRTRTMLELDGAGDAGGPASASGRRKQQSYSLEHLHGGALEMRSPCTPETKTIRMPCGNGQNYSVSPNQIVHLQDKLPSRSVRQPGASVKPALAGSTTTPNRTDSLLRKLFPTSSSSSHVGAGQEAAAGSSPVQSLTTTVPSNNTTTSSSSSSSSSSVIPLSSSASTASLPVSTVKTIVSELECNSGSANIPIAPPPLLTDPGAALAGSVPIPIASVAAEAAAVAVASAIREASRKNVVLDGGADTLLTAAADANSSAQWDPGEAIAPLAGEIKTAEPPPICWTSSAQIIQQCSGTAAFVEPVEPASSSSVEVCGRMVESEPVAEQQGVMRQCSWSSCDSSCAGIVDGPFVACFGQRCVPSGGGAARSGSAPPPIEEKEDIPWHPGTVKRTKKRIEERGSNAAAATSSSSTLKWTGPASEKVPAPVGHEPAHNLPSADPLHLPTNRARQGMVSSSYARLSASAPDSYNMYAGSRAGSTSGPALDPAQAAKRQTKLNQQHSFAAAVNLLARTGEPGAAAPYCLRVNVRGSTANRQPQKPEEAADEEDAFSAGKVRNLKMNFEAKSNDRRTGQKKVRSLPSSPVAVHVSMGGQAKQQQHQPIATAATPPSTVAASSPAKPLPEDVTVRDLVDRYEVHGPRMRPTGSNSLSRTQRPRSVFEPLKQGGKACVQAPGPLTHSTSQLRLDETMRPPVPPIVRGLVIPAHGAGGANTAHCSNNNSSSTTTTGNSHTYIGAGPSISATSNARNNNNNNNARSAASQQGAGGSAVEGRGVALSTVGGGKRMQQHGRTHPLAKISPGARHHHHHHIVHHHYTVGPLQQHRHMGAAPGPPVSGTTGPAATTVTANAYNTM